MCYSYVFSTSSVNCTSELLKLMISVCLYWYNQRHVTADRSEKGSTENTNFILGRRANNSEDEESMLASFDGDGDEPRQREFVPRPIPSRNIIAMLQRA